MKIKSKTIYDFVKYEMAEVIGFTGSQATMIGEMAARNFRLQNKRMKGYEEKDFETIDQWIDELMLLFTAPDKIMGEHVHNLFKWIVLKQREGKRGVDNSDQLRMIETQNNFTTHEMDFAEKAAVYWNG